MFDPVNRPYPNGISWGFRGFRIGRNQFGNWWFYIGLPFGFRYYKTLGKFRGLKKTTTSPEIQSSKRRNSKVNKWKNIK